MYSRTEAISELRTTLENGGFVSCSLTKDTKVTMINRKAATTQQLGNHEAELTFGEFSGLMLQMGAYRNHLGFQLRPSQLRKAA